MGWKDDFIEKIGAPDVGDLKIEEAQALKINNMPDFLYKYRPATDYAIENLRSDTVWLNKPSEYNDPFEFVEYLDFDKLNVILNGQMKEEIIAGMIKDNPVPDTVIEEARKSDYPIKVISTYQFKHYEKRSDEEIDELLRVSDEVLKKMIVDRNVEKIRTIQENMKVCSFCESHKNLLIWSHYADYHKGFCVEYNIGQWNSSDIRKRIMYPVTYKDSFFNFTSHLISQSESGDFNNLYPIISGTTKSLEWGYENEWRFIFAIGESFPKQNYPMDCQSKVFLGSRIDEAKKSIILDICRDKEMEMFEAIPSDEKYQLEFRKVEL